MALPRREFLAGVAGAAAALAPTNGLYAQIGSDGINLAPRRGFIVAGTFPITVGGDSTADFQTAIDALPTAGGLVWCPPDNYAGVVPANLSVGDKALNWFAEGSTLPVNMLGGVETCGIFSIPESAFQANRDVRVHHFFDYTPSQAVLDAGRPFGSLRQYHSHVRAFVPEDGGGPTSPQLEFRAYSYDLGTDVNRLVDCVRGIKGRVYATGGQANIRSIYGFCEALIGANFTGEMTGVLATVYANANVPIDAVGVRSHIDDGCSSAFQAAGIGKLKDGDGNSIERVGFGFSCRAGSGQPLLPSNACFFAHGGSEHVDTSLRGDMFQGWKSTTDSTRIVRITYTGIIQGTQFLVSNADGTSNFVTAYEPTNTTIMFQVRPSGTVFGAGGHTSGQSVNVLDDKVFTIPQTRTATGVLVLYGEALDNSCGICWVRTSGTALCRAISTGSIVEFTTGALADAGGTDGKLTISAANDGLMYISNRTGGTHTFSWTWLAY